MAGNFPLAALRPIDTGWTGSSTSPDALEHPLRLARAVQETDTGADSYAMLQTYIAYAESVVAQVTPIDSLVDYAVKNLTGMYDSVVENIGAAFELDDNDAAVTAGFVPTAFSGGDYTMAAPAGKLMPLDGNRRFRQDLTGTDAGYFAASSQTIFDASAQAIAFRFTVDIRNMEGSSADYLGEIGIAFVGADDDADAVIRVAPYYGSSSSLFVSSKGAGFDSEITSVDSILTGSRCLVDFYVLINDTQIEIRSLEGNQIGYAAHSGIVGRPVVFIKDNNQGAGYQVDVTISNPRTAFMAATAPASNFLSGAVPAEIDKIQLGRAIGLANGFTSSDYSTESYAVLSSAVSAAQTVDGDVAATESDATDAAGVIDDAVFQLLYAGSPCVYDMTGDVADVWTATDVVKWTHQDSTNRRIKLSADGTLKKVGMLSNEALSIGLFQNWNASVRMSTNADINGSFELTNVTVALIDPTDYSVLVQYTGGFENDSFLGTDFAVVGSNTQFVDIKLGVEYDTETEAGGVIIAVEGDPSPSTLLLDSETHPETALIFVGMNMPAGNSGGESVWADLDVRSSDGMATLCDFIVSIPDGKPVEEIIEEAQVAFEENMGPSVVQAPASGVGFQLLLAHSISLALAEDTAKGNTDLMDAIAAKFTANVGGMYSDASLSRWNCFMKQAHPQTATLYHTAIRAVYDHMGEETPDWLDQADEGTLCKLKGRGPVEKQQWYLTKIR